MLQGHQRGYKHQLLLPMLHQQQPPGHTWW